MTTITQGPWSTFAALADPEPPPRRYLSVAETAKLVRVQLKKSFPGVKFSVRSDSYSGGASIHVGWTNGPTKGAVEAVTEQFAGGRFDGMIDLKYHVEHWLLPDGTTQVRRVYGHGMGYDEDVTPEPPEGAVPVSLGADFVFANRDLTDEARTWVAALRDRTYAPSPGHEQDRRAWRISEHTTFPQDFPVSDPTTDTDDANDLLR